MTRNYIYIILSSILIITGCSKEEDESLEIDYSVQNKFYLNYEEQIAYDFLKDDLNDKYLKNLEPINIAKLYIQSQIDNRYDIEDTLYREKENSTKIDKSDSESQRKAKEIWIGIQNSEFNKSDEESSFVYETEEGEKVLNMQKNEDGIWKIETMPF